MDWLNHPRFVATRDSVLASLRRNEYRFRNVGAVVFLCGGADSPRRKTLARYIGKARKDALVFEAEAVWSIIVEHHPDANALETEGYLAALADIVVVIVESAGTLAELGAFAISPELRHKLLPVLDVAYAGHKSFVNTGPVRWVDADSTFAPCVWTKFDPILDAAPAILERLGRITSGRARTVGKLAQSPKHLLFFTADIISVFGPCPVEYVQFLLTETLGEPPQAEPTLLLALGEEMKLLKSFRVGGQRWYYRPLVQGRLRSFHRTKKLVDLPSLRANVIAAMLGFEDGRAALAQLALAC